MAPCTAPKRKTVYPWNPVPVSPGCPYGTRTAKFERHAHLQLLRHEPVHLGSSSATGISAQCVRAVYTLPVGAWSAFLPGRLCSGNRARTFGSRSPAYAHSPCEYRPYTWGASCRKGSGTDDGVLGVCIHLQNERQRQDQPGDLRNQFARGQTHAL
jgi:hypothetical protein